MCWHAVTCRCIASELNDMISCPSHLHEEMHMCYGELRNVWAAAGFWDETLLCVHAELILQLRVWSVYVHI